MRWLSQQSSERAFAATRDDASSAPQGKRDIAGRTSGLVRNNGRECFVVGVRHCTVIFAAAQPDINCALG
jgi:hypothetical protein